MVEFFDFTNAHICETSPWIKNVYGKSQLYDPYGITLTSNNKHLSHRCNKSFILIVLFNTCTVHKRQRHLKRIERSKEKRKILRATCEHTLRILFFTHAVLIFSFLLFYSFIRSNSSHTSCSIVLISIYTKMCSQEMRFICNISENHIHKSVLQNLINLILSTLIHAYR